MGCSAIRMRSTVAPFASIILATCLQCFGLDPRAAITQYAHIPWRVGERGLDAPPQSIAQTKDGYIWIGTRRQLYRFDGIQFIPLPDPETNIPHVQDTKFLFAASDGALYTSSRSYGVFRWKDGRIEKIGDNKGNPGPFAEDSSGTLWFPPGRYEDDSSICQISHLQEHCVSEAENGLRGPFASFLLEPGGGRWLGGENRLVHWMPGQPPQVFPFPEQSPTSSKMVVALASGKDGTILAGIEDGGGREGLVYLRQNKVKDYIIPGFDGRRVRVRSLFTDAAGVLWIGTSGDGLFRITGSRVDHFTSTDGLTGDVVNQIFEDHEGSMWIVTPQGLDQFYCPPVLTYGEHEGLTGAAVKAVAATTSGDEVWAGSLDGLYIVDASGSRRPRHITIPEIGSIGDLYRDLTGTMWVAGNRRLAYYKDDRFHLVGYKGNTDLGTVVELSEDASGDLWVVTLSSGYGSALNHIEDGVITQRYYWPKSSDRDPMSSISAHPGAGLWLCTVRGQLYWFHNGIFARILSQGGGFGLSPDRDGSWAYPANQLIRLQDGKMRTLKLQGVSATNNVINMIDDGRGSLWLYMSSGLVQVRTTDIQHWWDDKTKQVPWRLFDSSDGVFSGISTSRPAVSEDGQVWFSNGQNLQKIDPKRIPRNVAVPPVHIESIAADGKQFSLTANAVPLPSNVRNLEIHYSALSFMKQDKIQFRYRLVGLSDTWLDAGSRREAIYNNLTPGNYTFQVVAANSDGVWNTTGESLAVSVAAAWYQTSLFRLCALAAMILLLYGLMFLERRRYMRLVRARYQERLEERTRIARNLHDTLIQTIQGSKLLADHAQELPQDTEGMRHALKQLSTWLGGAIDEGRVALDSLRSTPPEDIATALFKAAEACIPESMRLNIVVDGSPRGIETSVQDEVHQIMAEGIRNACLHSGGSNLTIKVDYGRDFVITVTDNGRGGDVTLMREPKPGHYGIKGMYERARNIDAKLFIESSPGKGTTVTLCVPGRLAYQDTGFEWLVRKLRRKRPGSEENATEA
jgi:signal transduction histidine kinase/ligand-binding sensor domain-containing protein